VEAADAVGIPVCLSLAVVDPVTGDVQTQELFHTTGGAPGPIAEYLAGGWRN
jgi:hypothetical protein